MSIKREIFIILLIIGIIVFLEFLTNYILENSFNKIKKEIDFINEKLEEAVYLNDKNEITEKEKNDLNSLISKLKDDWMDEQEKLSYFSEHDELEKVSKAVFVMAENAQNGEYEIASSDGKEFLYLLEHVRDKDKFEFKNVF